MSIKSTRDIGRDEAIVRIKMVDDCIKNKNYRVLESITNEHEYNLADFIDHPQEAITILLITIQMGCWKK